MSGNPSIAEFFHAENGMTRFPANVEQLRVESGPAHCWLIARRNDVELRFLLREQDRRFLAGLLVAGLADSQALRRPDEIAADDW
ncbi:MAG: hypothetical protein F9K29_07945 [Hyphomicrobiaceae bacterium]|nr:MAG: hypothetical protein F9K29_07945 [Hyphomicrobiaceae bacterium]